MRKKILCYSPIEYDNTAFWRSSPLQYLDCEDYEIINGSNIIDWNWSPLLRVDILFFHRPCTPEHISMMQLAKDKGCKIIIDYDDNLFALDTSNPTWQFYQDMKLNVLKSLRIADEVWVTTEGVKAAYDKFNKNVVIIPNAWNNYLFPEEKKLKFNPNTKYCLWRGGSTHEADVYENPDGLVKVMNTYTDWTFQWWGHTFTYLEMRVKSNYIRKGAADTLQYFNSLFDYNPNIVIFPLMDSPFNKAKSNIVWMEATYAGAVCYSNTELPEFQQDSILDIDNLALDLETVKKYPDTYGQMVAENEASWEYIKSNLLLSDVNKLRHDSIMKLL